MEKEKICTLFSMILTRVNVEIFETFITRDFMENIVTETNTYYNLVSNQNPRAC